MLIVAFIVASNAESPFEIKRRSLDRRLQGSVRMGMFVAMFSCFFNFFQLTELDDFALPRSTSYVLDMSRPFEWICTCPLMQVVLVLVAGDKVPDYRLYMMPLLSLSVLILGVVAVSIENEIGRLMVFVFSFCIALTMFYFNRLMVLECSDGEEGIFIGSSPFRKLSLLLIVTWFPFPIWFFLSPEGTSVVTDIKVIQVGWAVLNIIAKGTFLVYLQKTKNDYFSEVLRDHQEFHGNGGDLTTETKHKFSELGNQDFTSIDLGSVVDEAMSFVALEAKKGRLNHLLKSARIDSCTKLDALDEGACRDASLPWELVYVMKRRLQARRTGQAVDIAAHNLMHQVGKNGHVAHHNMHTNGTSHLMSFVHEKDCNALRKAIADAESAGAKDEHLEIGRARLQEVRRWQIVREYLGKDEDFRAKIEGWDTARVQGAVEVADALGLMKLAREGRGNLDELHRRIASSKAAVKKGIALFKGQDFDAAVMSFSEAVEANPQNAEAFLNRSAAHGRLQNWDEAAADAACSIELDPGNVKAHHSRILALLHLGQAQAALDACTVGIAQHGEHDLLLRVRDKAQRRVSREQEEEQTLHEDALDAVAAEQAGVDEVDMTPRVPGASIRIAI